MSSSAVSALSLLFFLATTGCVHTPATYRLVRMDRGQVVVPPEVVKPDLPERTFVANLPAGKGPCALPHDVVKLQPYRGKLRISVSRDSLVKTQPGWLSDWSIQAEAQGCIAPGLARALADRVAQSLPLDSAVTFRLLHGDSVRAGFLDLGPQNRLEFHSPIVREGTLLDGAGPEIARIAGAGNRLEVELKSDPDTIGVETAWYGLERNTGRIGYHLVPLSAERRIEGVVEHKSAPAINYLRFPSEASFFRLFYKGDDNGVRAIVIAGATLDDLDGRTKAVGTDTGNCERSAGMCLVLPRRIGVNPFLVVQVNGSDVTIPLRATVAVAMRASGATALESLLPTLRVSKRFGDRLVPVEFDRNSQEILSLQLLGGEHISTR